MEGEQVSYLKMKSPLELNQEEHPTGRLHVYSNKHRDNNRQLSAASAVLYHNGRDWKHAKRVFGETITEADTTLRALPVALKILADFLMTHQPESTLKVLIATHSSFAVNKALKVNPHEEQEASIKCLTQLGELMDTYPNLNITLLWLPRKIPFVGFKRAKQLALEAIRMAEPKPDDEPHTIKHQKKKTKENTIAKWTEC